MKKVLLSLLTIAGVAVVTFGATQAFFSDTETSTGNILQAGALDLTIDSDCNYYHLAPEADGGGVGFGLFRD